MTLVLTSGVLRKPFTPSISSLIKSRKYATVTATHHWVYERALSIALVPLITSAFVVGPSPAIDFALGVAIPLHCHLGFETIITDYLPQRRNPILGKLAQYGLGFCTLLSIYGFYELNTKDVGITAYTAQLWNGLKANEQ